MKYLQYYGLLNGYNQHIIDLQKMKYYCAYVKEEKKVYRKGVPFHIIPFRNSESNPSSIGAYAMAKINGDDERKSTITTDHENVSLRRVGNYVYVYLKEEDNARSIIIPVDVKATMNGVEKSCTLYFYKASNNVLDNTIAYEILNNVGVGNVQRIVEIACGGASDSILYSLRCDNLLVQRDREIVDDDEYESITYSSNIIDDNSAIMKFKYHGQEKVFNVYKSSNNFYLADKDGKTITELNIIDNLYLKYYLFGSGHASYILCCNEVDDKYHTYTIFNSVRSKNTTNNILPLEELSVSQKTNNYVYGCNGNRLYVFGTYTNGNSLYTKAFHFVGTDPQAYFINVCGISGDGGNFVGTYSGTATFHMILAEDVDASTWYYQSDRTVAYFNWMSPSCAFTKNSEMPTKIILERTKNDNIENMPRLKYIDGYSIYSPSSYVIPHSINSAYITYENKFNIEDDYFITKEFLENLNK